MRAVIRQFPLAVGIAEGSDPKTLPPGTLLELVNGVWRKQGRVDKRYGTEGLTQNIIGGGTIGSARRLFTRGSELCLVTGTTLYSYTPNGWRRTANSGQLPSVGLTWSTLQSGFDGVKSADVALTSGGIVVHAWVTGDPNLSGDGRIYYRAYARSTGAVTTSVVAPLGALKTSTHVRALASGANWVIVFNDGTNIKCVVNGAAVATLRTDAKNVGPFDACIIGSTFVVAYALAAGGIGLYSYSIASTPVQQASGSVTGEATSVSAISIDGASGEPLWIGYCTSTSPKFRLATANASTLAQILAPTDVDTTADIKSPTVGVCRDTATSCIYGYSCHTEITAQPYGDGVTVTRSISSTGTLGTARTTYYTQLLSRPFWLGAKAYAYVGARLGAPATVDVADFIAGDTYLVDVSPVTVAQNHRLVGKIDVLIGGNWIRSYVANVVPVSAVETMCCLPYMARMPSAIVGWLQGSRLVHASWSAALPTDMWRSVELGGEAYLAAGVLTAYDGRLAFDYGWAHAPLIDHQRTVVSYGAGAMASGSYIYAIAPEYLSTANVLHRGPVSIPKTLAVTGPTGDVFLAVVPVHLSQKSDEEGSFAANPLPAMLAVYRTVADGTTPQRLTLEPAANLFPQNYAAAPNYFPDLVGDSNIYQTGITLAERPAIYTAGGELDDFQPPASLTLMLHKNRLWSLAGDGTTVWISKDHSANVGTAPGFHPTVTLTFDRTVQAFASMDEKAVVFAADRVWAVLGDGPAPNGSGSDFTIIPVQTDVGCTSARSVVGMPDGVMFVSARGFCLLTRGLEVLQVGQAVEDTLAAFPVVTSAVLVAAQNQVRWTCTNAANNEGRTIVFDYATKQWCVFSHSDAGVAGIAIADAVMWNGAWTFVTPQGKVYVEDSSTFLDGGNTWVTMSGVIAWISEGGPLGFQHIRRAFLLGDRLTDCGLTLKFGFNHKATYAQSFKWTWDKLAEIADGANVGMRVGSQNGASPRCRAFRLAWEDSSPAEGGPEAGYDVGTGEGVNLSAIGIEFIPRPEMDRRSARART